MTYFEDSLGVAITLCVVIAAAFAILAVRRRRAGLDWQRALGSLIRPAGLAMSVAAILAMTLYTPHWRYVLEVWQGERYFNGNLIPLHTITSYLRSTLSFSVVVQLLGNILLFVPLGVFLAVDGRHRLGKVVAMGAAGALLVEVLQFGLGRSVDIDDVILNVLGVLAGAGLAAGVRRASRTRSDLTAG